MKGLNLAVFAGNVKTEPQFGVTSAGVKACAILIVVELPSVKMDVRVNAYGPLVDIVQKLQISCGDAIIAYGSILDKDSPYVELKADNIILV